MNIIIPHITISMFLWFKHRSCTSSPKPPPTPSPSLHQGTLSALEAYSKLMQDRTFSSFKNRLLFLSQLQETQLRDRDELQETQLRDWDELQGTQPRERDELQDTQLRDRDELQGTQLRDRERDMVFLNELQDTQLWDKETCSSPQVGIVGKLSLLNHANFCLLKLYRSYLYYIHSLYQ